MTISVINYLETVNIDENNRECRLSLNTFFKYISGIDIKSVSVIDSTQRVKHIQFGYSFYSVAYTHCYCMTVIAVYRKICVRHDVIS